MLRPTKLIVALMKSVVTPRNTITSTKLFTNSLWLERKSLAPLRSLCDANCNLTRIHAAKPILLRSFQSKSNTTHTTVREFSKS
jgi:hypothetical protein